MTLDRIVFWMLIGAGAVLAGWWLAVRPASAGRDLATPVSFMTIVLAVLLCLLVLSGEDVSGVSSFCQYALGR